MRKVYSLLFQPQPRPPAIAWSSMISYDGDEMQVMADFNRDEINAVHVSNALSRSLSALTATHGDTMVDLQRVYPKPISQFSEPYYRGSRTRASLLPKLRQRRRARLSRICCSGINSGHLSSGGQQFSLALTTVSREGWTSPSCQISKTG